MFDKIAYNFFIAVESITFNRLRAVLTSLGIIFGVASVISMLAIGSGAQKEILDQIKLLGANNIIVKPVSKQEEGEISEEESLDLEEKQPYSPGLTMNDAESIVSMIPGVESVSPEVIVETTAIRSGLRRTTRLVGVGESFFDASSFELHEGRFFSDEHFDNSLPVAIIGHDIKTKFFTGEEAIGNRIKCGNLWLTVIGVLKERNIAIENIEELGIRNYDLDIYTPITTQLLRYENRAQLTQRDLQEGEQDRRRGIQSDESYHQLDRLVVPRGVSGSDSLCGFAVNRIKRAKDGRCHQYGDDAVFLRGFDHPCQVAGKIGDCGFGFGVGLTKSNQQPGWSSGECLVQPVRSKKLFQGLAGFRLVGNRHSGSHHHRQRIAPARATGNSWIGGRPAATYDDNASAFLCE